MSIAQQTDIQAGTQGATEADAGAPAEWLAWRAERQDQFREPYSWITFRGLTWLDSEPTAIPGTPGLWWTDGDAIHVTTAPTDSEALIVTSSGAAVTSELVVPQSNGYSQRPLTYAGPDGDVVVELLYFTNPDGSTHRGVRPRDPSNPLVTEFAGIPARDYDPEWAIDATLRYLDEPVAGVVGSEQPNLRFAVSIIGELELPLPTGETVTLQVNTLPDGTPSATFSDPAEGNAPWRMLRIEADQLDPATGAVRVDLNFVHNYPAGVHPHCFCPSELAANRLQVPVPVGELSGRS